MKKNEFTSIITKEKRWFVARCLELGVVSQGKTVAEAQANLKEAVELYIESFGRTNYAHALGGQECPPSKKIGNEPRLHS